MFNQIRKLLRNDEGLSLSEVLIAIGLSGLIAIGCTQLALASFNSAKYVETKALTTVSNATLNHTLVSDMELASSFVVHDGNPSASCTSKYSAGTNPGLVRPLFTVNNPDGTSIGYELRSNNGEGSVWRVACGTNLIQNGSTMLMRKGLPDLNSSSWVGVIKCVNYPAGGKLQTYDCPTNQILSSIITNPGILISIPASTSKDTSFFPSQEILAARNIA